MSGRVEDFRAQTSRKQAPPHKALQEGTRSSLSYGDVTTCYDVTRHSDQSEITKACYMLWCVVCAADVPEMVRSLYRKENGKI